MKGKIRICIVILHKDGGMYEYAVWLSRILAESCLLTIISPKNVRISDFPSNSKLIQTEVANNKKSLKNLYIVKLLYIIMKLDFNVLHFPGSHPWLLLILLVLRKKRIVCTIHDVRSHDGEESVLSSFTRRAMLFFSTLIFVHDKYSKGFLVRNDDIPSRKICVIPHGMFGHFGTAEVDVKGEYILFFGRISYYKGLKYLIKCAPYIKVRDNLLPIKIIGAGDLGKLHLLIKIQNITNFSFVNQYVPKEKIAKIFKRSLMVVLPYISATQSGIIPMSFSFGKPVIVTRVGGLPEVVTDMKTGIIVDPKNSLELVKAMKKLINNPKLRKKLAEKGQDWGKKHLGSDVLRKKYLKAYYSMK